MSLFDGLFKRPKYQRKTETKIVEPATFGGVPLSKLNSIAKDVDPWGKVELDAYGFLDFCYRTRSGKGYNRVQIHINSRGELEVIQNSTWPGQVYFPENTFVKEANKRFKFRK